MYWPGPKWINSVPFRYSYCLQRQAPLDLFSGGGGGIPKLRNMLVMGCAPSLKLFCLTVGVVERPFLQEG